VRLLETRSPETTLPVRPESLPAGIVVAQHRSRLGRRKRNRVSGTIASTIRADLDRRSPSLTRLGFLMQEA
jgi:hypothetical protein